MAAKCDAKTTAKESKSQFSKVITIYVAIARYNLIFNQLKHLLNRSYVGYYTGYIVHNDNAYDEKFKERAITRKRI